MPYTQLHASHWKQLFKKNTVIKVTTQIILIQHIRIVYPCTNMAYRLPNHQHISASALTWSAASEGTPASLAKGIPIFNKATTHYTTLTPYIVEDYTVYSTSHTYLFLYN